jgi:hypothetical protein
MPIRDMVRVHNPRMETYRGAFSTEFRLFTRDELQSANRAYGHCSRATLGAIYDSDGHLITLSERGGGRYGDLVVGLDAPWLIMRDDLTEMRHVPGKSLFLGNFMNHYGHFLVETMARFWSLDTGDFDNYIFFPFTFNDGKIMDYAFHKTVLRTYGIPLDKIIFLRSPTTFEEIHIPEQLLTINVNANINLPKIYRKMTQAVLKDTALSRIFLSRLQPYARVANIPEVEDVFRDFDFDRYANGRVMAGFAGSALHNCLFCREGTFLIEIGDIRSHSRPLITQGIANQVAGMEERYIPYIGSADGRIDTDALRRELAAVSLLAKDRAAATPASDFQARDVAHHYMWPGTMTLHMSNIGDIARSGKLEVSGIVEGRSAIEGFSIALDDTAPFAIEYKALLNDNTWTAWSPSGTFLGSRGKAKPIRGYAARLTSPGEPRFRCLCLGKFAGHAGLAEAFDGEDCVSPAGGHMLGLQLQLRRT